MKYPNYVHPEKIYQVQYELQGRLENRILRDWNASPELTPERAYARLDALLGSNGLPIKVISICRDYESEKREAEEWRQRNEQGS